MRFLRAALDEVVGLFVSDWTQTGITVAIIAVAWFAVPRLHLAAVAFAFALALAAQLVFATGAEARRTRALSDGQ